MAKIILVLVEGKIVELSDFSMSVYLVEAK